ncbi:dTDP-4-dehydrorhamnose reductase [Caballeronia novacaledonica]|uniref:dTDP-4-dehydrorhamnose reductase n=1 Tax=Caballeronia novacaledonica TaxID=1544861 RepID=A0A2U3I6S8_9BURK|nr:dTDP-4-dehydrorhamnose reductase [Caballeronia novacaledonica]SPB15828.1 dTDP-4-dehydrorhamnose reductase [Caballeronia novacaledonica]
MTILLTGVNGQIGFELARTLQGLGRVIAPDRNTLDLRDLDRVRNFVRETKPEVIVNPAAYTAVDRAEDERDEAHRLNAELPALFASECARTNAWFVHYSTDYVFDGAKSSPYVETDAAAPLNVYGEAKLAGERAIAQSGCRHLILRTSWVYGARGANFMRTILRLAEQRPELTIVADQFGAPTWSRTIAELTANMLSQIAAAERNRSVAFDEHRGIYHLTNHGRTSWYEFAREILRIWGKEDQTRIEPIPAAAYPVRARRPVNSCLSNEKLAKVFGLVAPDWLRALELCAQQG